MRFWGYEAMVLLHYETMIPDTVKLWFSDSMILWDYDLIVLHLILWDYDTVILWSYQAMRFCDHGREYEVWEFESVKVWEHGVWEKDTTILWSKEV